MRLGPQDTIEIPAGELACLNCRGTRQGKVVDPALYSRSTFVFREAQGKARAMTVEVRVKRLTRSLDAEQRVYLVSAVFDLRCPSCKDTAEREFMLARLPVRVAHELIACPTCGHHGTLVITALDSVERNASTDRISVHGYLHCEKCRAHLASNTIVNIDVPKVLQAASAALPREGALVSLDLDPWIGTADVCAGESVTAVEETSRQEELHGGVRPQSTPYDVAFSFAGEDRAFVGEVATYLQGMSVTVFYDRFESVELWGKDLYQHLDKVYRRSARVCVIFLSRHYVSKQWANHELRSAQARALEQNQEYILPFRFDDTDVPGLPPTIGYLRATDTSAKDLAEIVVKKLESLGYRSQPQ